MNQPEPQLRQFDIAQIGPGSAVLILGYRNTGKSQIAQSILRRCSSIADIRLVTDDELYPNFGYRAQFPNLVIYNDLPSQFGQQGPIAVVIDDYWRNESELPHHTEIHELVASRHQTASLFILTQIFPYRLLPHVLRDNCDYIIILGNYSHILAQIVYDRYAHFIPSFELFFRILRVATTDACGLILIQRPELPWQERVQLCRSPTPFSL
jgi:hypothetical protein